MEKKIKTYILHIDKELFKEFKKVCVEKDTPMSRVIRKLIKEYIDKNK